MLFKEYFANDIKYKKFKKDINQISLVEELSRLAVFWKKPFWKRWLNFSQQDQKGLYIYGSVGSGKTYIMDLFFRFFSGQKKRLHFKLFMLNLHKNGYERTFEEYKEIKLLCLDELEIIDISDAMIIKKIFESLTKNGVRAIITSNIEPQKLYEGGLHRERFEPFIHFITKHYYVFNLSSKKDYRVESFKSTSDLKSFPQKNYKNIYIIDQCLELEERSGHYAVKFEEIVHFRFGVTHYYELLKTLPVLYVYDMPKFNHQNKDILRKFINLVDVYYDESKVLKIESVDDLCFSKEIDLPISRMLSRIKEMDFTE